jgi:transcriptional regulator with XRE-family HTH domain
VLTVRRRRLALELRRQREAAKLTCEEVGERLECSASKISRIETGRVSVSPRDVRDMLEIYGTPADDRESLVQLARESRQKGWWHAWADSMQPHLATYLGLESDASEMRVYQTHRIPGLLQTEDYARAIFAAGRLSSSDPSEERQVALLTERQRQASSKPPKVWAILDEGTLRREVGGPEVMRAQIEHLRDLGTMPNFFLQVIPFRGSSYLPVDVPFVVLSFPDRHDPDVACLRYPTGCLWIEDVSEVARYSALFHRLQAAALPFAESSAFMDSVIKELS